MTNISLDTLRSLINFLTKKGLNRTELLSCVNLTELALNTHTTTNLINSDAHEALYVLAQHYLKDNEIGFEFGKTIEADRWGLLSYLAFTSPTLKVALEHQKKYQAFVGNIGTPILELNHKNIIIKWLPSYQCSHFIVEEIITGWLAMAQKISIDNVQPDTVYFSHACQGQLQNYQNFYQCNIEFSNDFNGIKIDQSFLTKPLGQYSADMQHVLCQFADSKINLLAENTPVEVLNQFITNQLPSGVPEIEDAAQHLQISIRTLQRKLSEHKWTFTSLIDSIRQKLAISYLENTDTKIIYISQMLGFSEQSAFQRAFKRWTNQTPKQYRNNIKTT